MLGKLMKYKKEKGAVAFTLNALNTFQSKSLKN